MLNAATAVIYALGPSARGAEEFVAANKPGRLEQWARALVDPQTGRRVAWGLFLVAQVVQPRMWIVATG
ncbi:hypothetical protein PC120_g28557 [Phytophthora cactorum]|nr:hypothetical protein PC120_g28557 [Phytophthora cactorum]